MNVDVDFPVILPPLQLLQASQDVLLQLTVAVELVWYEGPARGGISESGGRTENTSDPPQSSSEVPGVEILHHVRRAGPVGKTARLVSGCRELSHQDRFVHPVVLWSVG